MSDHNIILEAHDLHKSYDNRSGEGKLDVLQGMNLQIEKGSITAVVGSSGSGKSTLLHILGGLDKPDSGEIYWEGNDIAKYKPDDLAIFRNKYLGFVFQFHHLLPEFTAVENVAMPALINGTSYQTATDKALKLLANFDIENRSEHRPSQLSGGEQQRVSMARALMNDPQLLLADEPTGNLDATNTNIILDLLFNLRESYGISVLLITHEHEIAQRADTILELKNGVLNPL